MRWLAVISTTLLFLLAGCNVNDFLNGDNTVQPPPPVPVVTIPHNNSWENISNPSNDQPIMNPILLDITFMSVGESDAIIVQYDTESAMIDCGNEFVGDDIVAYLHRRGVTSIKYMFITHPDSDHLGSCDNVIGNFSIGEIIMNGETKTTKSYQQVINMVNVRNNTMSTGKEGNTFTIGPSTLQIIQASRGADDSNQNSLVIRLDYSHFSALFTGDCDRECEGGLLLKNVDVDLLKVAHHGSKYGTSEQFVYATSPKIAVISVGPNTYGHPDADVISRLNSAKSEVYRTDEWYYLSVLSDGDKYAVQGR